MKEIHKVQTPHLLAQSKALRLMTLGILLLAGSALGSSLRGNACESTSYFTLLRASDTQGLGLSNSGGVQAASQSFEAPQLLRLTGFSFYAYVAPGAAVEVTASLYLPDMDGFPTGAPLASTTVTVDNMMGSLTSMRHQATFADSILVDQDYLLMIENDSPTVLQLIVSDYNANDGEGEGLNSLLVDGMWQNGLNYMIGKNVFDADVLLQPDYQVVDFFVDIESPAPCLEAPGALEFTATGSPVFLNRFYNADLDNAYSWNFGDGSAGSGVTVQNTYDAVGPWTVRVTGTLHSGQGDICSANGQRSFGAIPTVFDVAIVEHYANLEVTFSPDAIGTEGWLWDFGDGTNSSAQAPRHIYPSLGFFTACMTTWNQCGTIPELCFEVLSPFPDLSVVVETPVQELDPGSALTYTVEVWNFSGATSGPQTFTHALPAPLTNVSWTCTVNGTGSCTAAGTESIEDSIHLDPQSTLTYTISGTYDPEVDEPLYLFAEVTVPSGDETDNNSDFAFIVAPGTLFADGFETGDTSRWGATLNRPSPLAKPESQGVPQ